jgi:hypothetical protein
VILSQQSVHLLSWNSLRMYSSLPSLSLQFHYQSALKKNSSLFPQKRKRKNTISIVQFKYHNNSFELNDKTTIQNSYIIIYNYANNNSFKLTKHFNIDNDISFHSGAPLLCFIHLIASNNKSERPFEFSFYENYNEAVTRESQF